MTAALFGFGGEPVTALGCKEYDALWDQLNGNPRYAEGRLRPFSTYTGDDETLTAWGFDGQDVPALGERVRTGRGCEHWLFAEERAT